MKTCNTPMTDRQREIFEFIRSRPVVPTVREIGRHFGIRSPNGVLCHLKSLERKGLIRRDPQKSRGIEIADGPTAAALKQLLSGQNLDGQEIAIGSGLYRLQYIRPTTSEECR